MRRKREKIFVGISGGVDSSVAAYLLKKEGYEVHGVFVKTWSPEWLPCTWLEEKRDAMRVCAALNIPFHFLDAAEAYKREVADYMIAEYRAGRTPNPDVLCNRVIKFGVMWEYAKEQGAKAIATGHYAQTDGKDLFKSFDKAKDQSYFLWMIEKEEFAHIKFPIGHLKKAAVREIAQKKGLFTGTKKDSQGICFLGAIEMQDFLSHYIEQKKGAVITKDGTVIGEHSGIWFYTLGERHGFTVFKKSTNEKPYYVIGKNIEKNELIVSHEKVVLEGKKRTQEVVLRNQRLPKEKQANLQAQIRYHGELLPAKITGSTTVLLTTKEALPPGQSVVLYSGEKLIGGGIIEHLL